MKNNRKCKEIAFNSVKESELTSRNIQGFDDLEVDELNPMKTEKLSKEEEKIKLMSEENVLCIACNGQFKRNSILKHVMQKESCKRGYSSFQLDELKRVCKNSKDKKLRLWNWRRTPVSSKEHTKESYYDNYKKAMLKRLPAPYNIRNVEVRVKVKPLDKTICCIGCEKPFPTNKILKHVMQRKRCKKQYSSNDLQALKSKCRQFSLDNLHYNQQKAKLEAKSEERLKHRKQAKLHRYRILKSKIEDWHFKCLQAMDMDKYLHYRWEYKKVKVKSCERYHLKHLDQLFQLSQDLDQKIIQLEELIENENHFKEIKDNTSKWCFDEYEKPVEMLHEDNQQIEKKCGEMHKKILCEFNQQLNLFFNGLKKFCEDFKIMVNLNPYQYKHQHQWEYEKVWQKYENSQHRKPNQDEAKTRDDFILKEIVKKTKG